MTFMENTALSKDTFYVVQDTNAVIEKEELLSIIWNNPSLLNDVILKKFYDSIRNAPMGQILAVDTSMASSSSNINYPSLLSLLNAIIPVNNIEANLQTATAGYLSFLINDSLSASELTTLRTLANKCPDWDGNGVYQARALLALFDPPSAVYPNNCNSNLHVQHKPDKRNEIFEPIFDLYPNPNNGSFTLDYQLGKGHIVF